MADGGFADAAEREWAVALDGFRDLGVTRRSMLQNLAVTGSRLSSSVA